MLRIIAPPFPTMMPFCPSRSTTIEAERTVVMLWCARLTWALLPVSAGLAFTDALDGWDTGPSKTGQSFVVDRTEVTAKPIVKAGLYQADGRALEFGFVSLRGDRIQFTSVLRRPDGSL